MAYAVFAVAHYERRYKPHGKHSVAGVNSVIETVMLRKKDETKELRQLLEEWLHFAISTKELVAAIRPEPLYEEGGAYIPHGADVDTYYNALKHVPLAESERKYFAKFLTAGRDIGVVLARTLPYAVDVKTEQKYVKYPRSEVSYDYYLYDYMLYTAVSAARPYRSP